ncbi:MAG TPA: PKD domain-containing protein [Saprospiraceae bacterium]|nr:PKD domain-containing protein [Saprospiraceae bacterium]
MTQFDFSFSGYRQLSLLIISSLFVFAHADLIAQREYPYQPRLTETVPAWVTTMYKTDADPGEVMSLYDEYYKTNPFVKNQHTQYYKRWISGLSKNVVPNPYYDSIYLQNYFDLKNQRSSSNWSTLGPIDWDHDAASRSYAPGSAHVYTVEQSISDENIIYAGTANAGVWKSTDRGISWTPKTNDLLTGGVTSIEINPTNANIVYAELLSNIYKSTNGGNSWQPTGDGSFMALTFATRDIRCKPDQPTTVFAATEDGLFRTTNSGTTWTNVLGGDALEIEFHPNDPDTMYVVRRNGDITEFFRSYNAGTTFTQQTTGWPAPNLGLEEHQQRTEIAVTPDAPDKVYALATGSANGGSGLYGVYVSADRGATWTFQCCGPGPGGPPSSSNMNLMGWSDQGLDDGGQYYYDLAFGVSPYNKDSMWVCGVNLWVSGNEGASFVCPSAWSHSYKPNYVHADIHDLHYMEHSGELWVCGDGGIFYSNDRGANFSRRNVGITGSDFWGFGMGHWYGDVMIGGAYHNGTLMKEENTYINGWICTDGGDGVGGFVNPGYDRQAYSNYNIKQLQSNRTISPVTRDFQFQPNSTYITGKSSDLLFHPHYYGTWYTGSGTKLYLTRDNGFTYEEIYNFGVDVAAMDMCHADPDVLYACTFPDWWGTKRIYRSLNGGATWTEITPPAALMNNEHLWIPYDITVDPNNPMKIWMVRTSMYNGYPAYNGFKAYTSDNGGSTWTNISGTALDGQYPTNLMHQRGTNGGIYIGTRNSVYYRNATMPEWVLFNSGLPARTNSVKMLPWYRNGVLRNATDRSVWESPFYEASQPMAIPGVHKQYLFCDRDTAYFTDLSVLKETNATWSWSFPGGTPSTSTIRNPKVVYKSPGVYDVTLIVHDVNGDDTTTVDGMIIADNRCALDTTPGSAMKIASSPGYLKVDDISLTTQTLTVTAWIKPTGIQSEYSGIWMNDGTAAGFNFRESNNTLAYHWPGGAWWWDSNLTVTPGEWSYVAMVVKPGSVTLYVNGVPAVHNTSVESVTIDNVRIGSYQGWNDRNFKGEIDEVCVWNRALTEDEIRLGRHLTKNPSIDQTIVAYYQFDDVSSGEVIDKASGVDGVLSGNANIIPSNVAVGSGTSQILLVQNNGNVSFTNGGDLSIGFGALNPNGKVVVSHLNVLPDTVPQIKTPQGAYWIVNNYGTNQEIPSLDSINFYDCGALSHLMADDFEFKIYKRAANAFGPVWGEIFPGMMIPYPGLNATIKSKTLASVRSLGQLLIMRDTVISGHADVVIKTPDAPDPFVHGGESVSLLVYSGQQGMQLPVITATALSNLGTPTGGQLAYLSDSAAVVFFNGTQWRQILQDPVLQFTADEAPVSFGTLSMPSSTISSSSLLKLGDGLVNLPVFTASEILNIQHPTPGMIIYDSDSDVVRCYNGNEWQPMASFATNLPVSMAPSTLVPGIAVNQNFKYPSSVMDINPTGGKAFLLPILDPDQIYTPVTGLICFNPTNNKLMLFDGLNWNVLR